MHLIRPSFKRHSDQHICFPQQSLLSRPLTVAPRQPARKQREAIARLPKTVKTVNALCSKTALGHDQRRPVNRRPAVPDQDHLPKTVTTVNAASTVKTVNAARTPKTVKTVNTTVPVEVEEVLHSANNHHPLLASVTNIEHCPHLLNPSHPVSDPHQ